MGSVIASGTVMARAADTSWPAVAVTIAAAAITLGPRLSPLWTLLVGGVLGCLGLLRKSHQPVRMISARPDSNKGRRRLRMRAFRR
jgi:hypothetical protein